jgi:hypothetical protein
MDPLTQAFPRYARHQSPAPILARASLKRPLPQAPITISKRGRLQASTAKVCTWSDVRVLGTMIQGATKLLIVSTHEDNSKLRLNDWISCAWSKISPILYGARFPFL